MGKFVGNFEKARALEGSVGRVLKEMHLDECTAYVYFYTSYLSKKDSRTKICIRVRGLQKYPREMALKFKDRIEEQFCESLEYRESKAIRFMDFFCA